MKEDISLIATLPNLNFKDKVVQILTNPYISEVRYNTGINELQTSLEIMQLLKHIEITYKKKIWIDLKGRQLRITKWADPLYEAIELNHDIELTYPAKVIFRDGSSSEIVRTRQNKILVNPPPKEAVGNGQSINIIAKDLDIKGYLTPKDEEILKLCQQLEFNNIMASFVEQISDISDIISILPNANVIAKIESLKGLKFILEHSNISLMAARDDLFTELEFKYEIIEYLKQIIKIDSNAICASKIFSSLKSNKQISLSDYSDLELMYLLGYRKFMLDDTISNYYFEPAITAWKGFVKK